MNSKIRCKNDEADSKNLPKKDFIRCKEAKSICKKIFSFRVKQYWDLQYPENFPETLMIGTTGYRQLKQTSVSSDWLE